MFLYKLKKVLKEKRVDLWKTSFSFSLIVSFYPLFVMAFIFNDDFSISDKKQMAITSAILTFLNFTIIYFVDYFFKYNIIFCILSGQIFCFFVFFIPIFIFAVYQEIIDLKLDKSEIREAKLNKVFRKLF